MDQGVTRPSRVRWAYLNRAFKNMLARRPGAERKVQIPSVKAQTMSALGH